MLKNQIFISYRRCDGKTVAKFLYDYLTHMNYLVFWDEESAHNGRFDEAIYNAIDECKDFILIVSPKVAEFDNKDNRWVYRELSYALKKQKNIVPIFLGKIELHFEKWPENIRSVEYINGIDLSEGRLPFDKLIELLTAKPHFFRNKSKIVENNNKFIKKINLIILRVWFGLLIWLALYIIIHYTFNETWEMPHIIWRICKAFKELSIYTILLLQTGTILCMKVIVHYLKINNRYYILKNWGDRNIDDNEFYTASYFLNIEMQSVDSKRYLKNEKKLHITNDQKNCLYYDQIAGMIIASNDSENVGYFALEYKLWPSIFVYCIGKYTMKSDAIQIMNEQDFGYKGTQNNIAYFDNDEMDIRIMYGRVWPKSIEIINKVSVGIEDILFEQQKEQQTIILEGKNGDNYKVEILDQINYKNTNYYVVITCEKYENIDMHTPIVLMINGTYYETADSDVAKIVFAIFRDRHIDEYEFMERS